MSITTTAIVQEYGAFYQDAGQNKKRILSMLSQGREITNLATPIKTDDTIYRLANASFRTLVQPFQKTFTQKGGVEIVPNEIRVFRFKIDDEFMPDELYGTWLGFLAKGGLNRKDWPFVKWLIEVYYARQIDQDMELNEYYKGVYKAPATGVAGADGTGMDGLKKQLQAGVDADTMNSVDVGSLHADTIFDQVELFVDKIAEVYQGIPMDVCMSKYWTKKYLQDKRSQGFYQNKSDKEINTGIDFTPQDVKGLASMVGTDDIFCTPKENFLHLSPITMTKNQFKIEEAKRAVAVMGDWSEGLGFGINQAVWTNIQKSAGSGSV
ncbi:hypothetical protein [Sunxiuqinia sp. sy24]|uniref:hypothetical protein n=1 Tax=Sunxiuqinia sp. sy24 TaxID=3461495 RepID=UPI0040456FB2